MSNTYNLQLRHGAESQNFDTREKVIGYIDGVLKYGSGQILPYEPILFFYGEDDSNKNAIILVGLPEGKTNDGKSYFLIDTAAIKEQIEDGNTETDKAIEDIKEALSKETEERETADKALETALDDERGVRGATDDLIMSGLNDEISNREKADKELSEGVEMTKEDLSSVIDACGLIYNEKLSEDRVSYEPDSHDEVIRDAESIADAIDKISKFATKLGSSLKVNVEDTDTVKLTMNEDTKTSEKTLTADVIIAGTEGLSTKNFDNNILGKTTDGIYAACSLDADPTKPNHLIFRTSGYVDGKFKVDAFETEVELTSYKGNDGDKTGIKVTVDEEKNEISAELKIATDADNNILKMEDGEFYVEGLAKNIKYGDTTVAKALNSHKNRLDEIEDAIDDVKAVEISGDETDTTTTTVDKSKKGDFTVSTDVKLSSNNSIIVADGGLSANVSASYVEGTSKLTIKVGKETTEIDLSSLGISVLEEATYDSVNEELILKFNVNGETKTVKIPVNTLIHDIKEKDTNTVDLTIESVLGGPNVISADVKVNKVKTDNIIAATPNGLYVSKSHITDAVKEETVRAEEVENDIKSSIEKLTETVGSVKDSVSAEEKRATTAEAANKATAESALGKANENAENIKALTTKVNDISVTVTEVSTKVDNLSKTIDDNKTATDKVISDLKDDTAKSIIKVEQSVSDEVARATKAEETLTETVTNEISRAKDAESKITTHITDEVTRATNAETEINGKVDTLSANVTSEVERAKAAESTLTQSIADNLTTAKAYTDAAKNDVLAKVSTEEARAMGVENALKTQIDTINGTADVNGSFAKADAEVLASSKAYTTEQISDESAKRETEYLKLSQSINDEVTRAQNAESKHDDAIAIMNGSETTDGSIKKSLKDAKDYTDKEVSSLKSTVESEIAEAVKSAGDTTTNKVDEVLKETKAYTDEKVTDETSKREEADTKLEEKIDSVKIEKDSTSDLKYNLLVDGKVVSEINIPKDQFLKDVVYDGGNKQIVFTFETSDGTKVSNVDVSDLVDTYTAGDGLKLTDNKFSVVIEEHSEEYLKVTENGIMLTGVKAALDAKATTDSVKELSDKIDVINGNSQMDGSFAKADADTLKSAKEYVDSKVTDINKSETDLSAKIEEEANIARAAEKANADAIAIINGNEAQEGSIKKTLKDAKDYADNINTTLSDSKLDKSTYETDKATFALKSEIPTVPTNVSAFTNDAGYLTEHQSLADYLKSADAEKTYATKESVEKLSATVDTKANKADVETALSEKLGVETASLTYATKESVESIKDTYATKEYVDSQDEKLNESISSNTVKIDNFGLTYNSATSELTYTDKNGKENVYKLYSGSLIKSGTFDTKSNSIVLTIETAGQESQITIPVTELLSEVDESIKTNASDIKKIKEDIAKLSKDWVAETSNTVTLTKSTVGDKDTLTASVNISTATNNAIKHDDAGLYVSTNLDDYTCVFGGEGTVTGQTAISKLLESTKSNATEIDKMKSDIESTKNDIASLKVDVANNNTSITNLDSRVTTNSTNIATLQSDVKNLTTRVEKTEGDITTINNNITELSSKVEKVEKQVTEIVNNFENGDFKEMKEAINEIKNTLIGNSDGSTKGSLWEAIQNIIDAGTY